MNSEQWDSWLLEHDDSDVRALWDYLKSVIPSARPPSQIIPHDIHNFTNEDLRAKWKILWFSGDAPWHESRLGWDGGLSTEAWSGVEFEGRYAFYIYFYPGGLSEWDYLDQILEGECEEFGGLFSASLVPGSWPENVLHNLENAMGSELVPISQEDFE